MENKQKFLWLYNMGFSFFTILSVIGVIFVNGWTDAPNAITGCVCTNTLKMKTAVVMAAVCNFLGVFITSKISNSVAKNIFEAANGGNVLLFGVMVSVIILAVGAWVFGIPTSESHALVAALCGGALALGNGINTRMLMLTLTGLIISVGLGFILGYIIYKSILKRAVSDKSIKRAQIFGAAFMAFMHGAQDGQKFISIFIAAAGLGFQMPTWVIVLCSAVMAAGTLTGGGRIIRNVGMRMVELNLKQAIAADIAGGISLLLSTVSGLPVSTTHAKTASVMGCGYVSGKIDKKAASEMLTAWIITFPICFGLGFILCMIIV